MITARQDDADKKRRSESPPIIISRVLHFAAVQIVDRSAEVAQFSDKVMECTYECGDIFRCHERNLLFVAVAHPKENEVDNHFC